MEGVTRTPAAEASAQISRAVVGVHARFYGRGPREARTILADGTVVCLLEDIYTPAENTLIGAGQFLRVRETRMAFQDAVEPLFRGAVEEALQRPVRAFFSQISHDPPMAAEIFVLEPAAEAGAGEDDTFG